MTPSINRPISDVAMIPQNVLPLPLDIFAKVLTHLSAKEIRACDQVCKQWNEMLKSDRVWHLLFDNHFSSRPSSPIKNFRDAYKATHLNLTKGRSTLQILQRGHRLWFLAIANGRLFSYTLNHDKIMIWDTNTLECIAIFNSNRKNSTAFVCVEGKFFSGSVDGTIDVWEASTDEHLASFQGPRESVTALTFAEGKLFSGFFSGTVQVWDINTGICTATWAQRPWRGKVESLACAEGKLFSSFSCEIHVRDIATGNCEAILQEGGRAVTCFTLAEGNIFAAFGSASHSAIIKIWDIHSLNRIAVFQTQDRRTITSLASANGHLFLGFPDGAIEILDANSGRCSATFNECERLISLASAQGKLFASFFDNTIKVWDFTANHSTIFQEIAKEIESPQTDLGRTTWLALDRFSRMPNMAKNAIYQKLHEICSPIIGHYLGDDDFYWRHCAIPEHQAQAIRNYLNDEKHF